MWLWCQKKQMFYLILAFAFSVIGYKVLFGIKWQITKLVREDSVCSSTLTEHQKKRDDCRKRQNIQINVTFM